MTSSRAVFAPSTRWKFHLRRLAVVSLLGALTATASCRLFNRAYACDDDSNCGADQFCNDGQCEVGDAPSPENEPSPRDGGEPGVEADVGEPGVGPGVEPDDDAGEPGVGPGAEPDDGGEPDVGPGVEPEDGGASPSVPVDGGNEPAVDAGDEPEVDAGNEPAVDAGNEPEVDAGPCGGANFDTDPDNCGACGRTCGGSIGCTDGFCEEEHLFEFDSSDGKILSRNGVLFYADFGAGKQVVRVDGLATGNFTQSNVRVDTSRLVFDMALTGTDVVLSTSGLPPSTSFIEIGPLGGTINKAVDIGMGNITSDANRGFAISPGVALGMTNSRIKRFSISTGLVITDNAISPSFPSNTVFDGQNIYWLTDNNALFKSVLATTTDTGTPCGTITNSPVLGVGQSPQALYYALNTSPIRIVRVNKGDCTQSLLVNDIQVTSFGALVGTDQEVFYSVKSANTLTIFRFHIGTATRTPIYDKTVPGASDLISMALDGPYLYLLESEPNRNDINRVRLPPP